MKYQCVDPKCKAIFSHPAKQTKLTMTLSIDLKDEEAMKMQTQNTEGIETHVCPICHGLFFTEYDEPKPEISSVISVDLSQVDGYLAKGYVVHELYAKTATLKMLKVGESLAEIIAKVKQSKAPVDAKPIEQKIADALNITEAKKNVC
jgi:hypothetical protein